MSEFKREAGRPADWCPECFTEHGLKTPCVTEEFVFLDADFKPEESERTLDVVDFFEKRGRSET